MYSSALEPEKKRILITSLHGHVSLKPEFGKPDTGGQIAYVLELAKQFVAKGYLVDIVTRQFERQPSVEFSNDGCKIWRIPYGGKTFLRKEDGHDHLYEFIQNFNREMQLRNIQYDVAFSHYWDAGWATQIICDQWKIPHVFVPHSLGWWKRKFNGGSEEKYRYKERIRKEQDVLRACDQVIATSPYQKEILEDIYKCRSPKIQTIPPGFAAEIFTPPKEEEIQKFKLGHDIRPKDVLLVGRAAYNKGFDLMIEALPHLIFKNPEIRLLACIGGTGSRRDQEKVAILKKQSERRHIDKHIQWRGYISNEDLPMYYASAGVFVLCSRYEPFGMTALEAMACGTPSIITEQGGLKYFLEPALKILVHNPEQPLEFAKGIYKIISQPQLRADLGQEVARFAQGFTWEKIADRIETAFTQVRSKSKGKSVLPTPR